MFSKAKVKRFNDEVGCAPAPNAYDAKFPVGKGAGVAACKSRRFDDSKEQTPGPGQYLLPPMGGASKPLARSASFRVASVSKRGSKADLTINSSRADLFKTPCSTPRKMRRSISTGDMSVVLSPVRRMRDESNMEEAEITVEGLQKKNEELEKQLREALDKFKASEDSIVVKCNHEDVDSVLKTRVEQLEAELEVTKVELRLRQEDVNEENDKMAEQLDSLRLQSDIASTLKSENELLNQDNQTLEEELAVARAEREKVELELVDMRQVRKDLEFKFKEEDAKNIFLHFTQEQLNSQVLSLETVVKNLKTENHLLNKGIGNLVLKVQSEKHKFEEISEQYNTDNADSEEEFKQLQADLDQAKAESKTLQVDLRAKLGESEVFKNELKDQVEVLQSANDELKKDLEVSENDKTVLRDTLEATEMEKNNTALDLAQVSKQKMELEKLQTVHLSKLNDVEKLAKEANHDMNEIEMAKVGLEGEVSSLREEVSQLEESNSTMREEVSQLEVTNCDLRDQLVDAVDKVSSLEILVEQKSETYTTLEVHFAAQEEVLTENKNLVKKLEELHELSQHNAQNLQEELAIHKNEQAKLESEINNLLASEKELSSQIEAIENERDKVAFELSEVKVSKEEVEESLLETQGLVEEMESRLSEAHSKHREEATELSERLRQVNISLEDCKGERGSLLEMNTSLSGQVAEALHSIHALQVREDSLQQELNMVKQFMEAAQEDGEQDRIRIMQSEDEILSLQAELDETLLEMDESNRRARYHAERGEYTQQMVDKLNSDMTAVKEDLGAQLDTVKSAYNSAVAELSESKTVGAQLLDRLNKVESEVDTKTVENEKLLHDFQDRNQEALDDIKKSKESFDQERKLMNENITHLESLRDNLEKSLSEKTEVVYACKQEMSDTQELMNTFKLKNEEIVKNNLRLKGNLEVRLIEVANLKEEILKKENKILVEKETHEKLKLEQKSANEKVAELLEQNADAERLRTAELEMCIELREKLEDMKIVAEEGESAKRSMEAQQVVLMEAEGRAEEALVAVEKWREKLQEAEEMMKGMEERMEQLEEEASYHREQHQLLQDMVEPFKEQLEGFEMEKRALMSQSEAAQGEVKKLATQYGSLLGHQNHSQKIQHVVKIKQENVNLKTEVTALKEQLSKAKRSNGRLEERLNDALGMTRFDPRLSFQPQPSRNKENLLGGTPASKGVFQTPQGGPQGAKTSRQSTGSPLARVNRN